MCRGRLNSFGLSAELCKDPSRSFAQSGQKLIYPFVLCEVLARRAVGNLADDRRVQGSGDRYSPRQTARHPGRHIPNVGKTDKTCAFSNKFALYYCAKRFYLTVSQSTEIKLTRPTKLKGRNQVKNLSMIFS
jgi:hypothetical protein